MKGVMKREMLLEYASVYELDKLDRLNKELNEVYEHGMSQQIVLAEARRNDYRMELLDRCRMRSALGDLCFVC